MTTVGRRWVTPALAVAVVLAGCAGAGAPGATPQPTNTPDPNATSTGPPAAVTPPLSVEVLQSKHRERLREAGSFTFRRDRIMRYVDSGTTQTIRVRGRYDFEDGTALVRRNSSSRFGVNRTTYLSPDGNAYRRVVTAAGPEYLGPGEVTPPNLSTAAVPALLGIVAATDMQYEGQSSRAGVEGYVYEASGPGMATESVLANLNVSRNQLRQYELTLVLSERGRIKYVSLSVAADLEDRSIALVERQQYVRVGATTVPEPDWIETARDRTGGLVRPQSP